MHSRYGADGAGAGAKIRRHSEDLVFRQPGEHVAARGSDRRGAAADDGGVQQSRHVRPADGAEQPATRSSPIWPTSWAWSEDGKELTFPLRQGVKWHDGKPFTAADVKCTWDLLLGNGSEKLRVNPRKTWYLNLEKVTTNGDYEATFHLKRPQPALLSLLASGWSPVYPCHVPPARDAHQPIGTGPFKFVEFKPNEVIKTARNPDYWKPGRPYLDGIEWHDHAGHASTRNLAFIAGKFDITSPYGTTVPLLKDIKSQAPQAICELTSTNVSRNLILNPEKPPFDNPELRRAVALSLDRKAFIDIIAAGQGRYRRARCCRRRKGCGACRRKCWRPCRATIPISRRTAPRRARSWKSSATGRTSGSPSRCRRATSRLTAIRR